VICCALAVAVAAAQNPPPAAWVTLKGQVVIPANVPVPQRKPLTVGGPDAPACMKNGPILDESVIVSPKTRGVKNVVVWLRPNDAVSPKAALAPNEIHPGDAKRKPAEVVIDQPCCMFVGRVSCARVGDTIEVKNPATFPHNFFWVSENNGALNQNIPAGGSFKFGPLVAESSPIQYKCTIHPWMDGYVRIFDHPYYAVTDDDGKFEINNAPVGNYRLVYWHEKVGFKGGRAGRFGDPVAIADGGKGVMEMKPTDWDVK